MSKFWDRLEPNSTDETLLEGLQTRVADPLWMLARQWQSGELDGEDAATPLKVIASTESLPMTQMESVDGTMRELPDHVPLEPVIEAIFPSKTSAEDIASLCVAGLQLLEEHGIRSSETLGMLRDIYPLKSEFYYPDHPIPGQATRRLRLLTRRGFDVFALAADNGGLILAKDARLGRWVADLQALVGARGREIAIKDDAWQSEKLAYGGTLSAHSKAQSVQMKLADYGGGRLDWYSFDVGKGGALADPVHFSKINETRHETIPIPLSYAGQPVARHWEFEDGEVHFGGINAGPGDIARMVVADFAAIGGDDTFVLPIEMPVGALSRVKALYVIDSFGSAADRGVLKGKALPKPADLPAHIHAILPAEVVDRNRRESGQDLRFQMFALDGAPAASGQTGSWVPIFPVTAKSMNGKTVEKVSLRRDGEANIAWAIEDEIEGPFGQPLRRRQAWEVEPFAEIKDGDAWPYRIQTAIPPWWIPLVPERLESSEQFRLRRARLGAWETMDPATTGPKSRLMDPTRKVLLEEAALPVSGARISRHWQLARAYDGRVILWHSWKREFGSSDRLSGLSYDSIARRW